jgi:hypothetical protein
VFLVFKNIGKLNVQKTTSLAELAKEFKRKEKLILQEAFKCMNDRIKEARSKFD